MAGRRDIEVMNVSFLDLFACAIGAVTFIIILLYLSSLNLVLPSAKPAAPAVSESDVARLEKEAAVALAAGGRLREDLKKAEAGRTTAEKGAAEAEKAMAEARARVDKAAGDSPEIRDLRARVEKGRTLLKSAEDEKARADAELRDLRDREKTAAAEVEALKKGMAGRQVEYRIPLERATTKQQGVVLDCTQDRVYLFGTDAYQGTEYVKTKSNDARFTAYAKEFQVRPRKEEQITEDLSKILEPRPLKWASVGAAFSITRTIDFTKGDIGLMWKASRKPSARGETAATLADPKTPFRRTLSAVDPAQNYVVMLVRPSGYAVFRELRRMLEAEGYEVTWFYRAEGGAVWNMFGGGAQATVK